MALREVYRQLPDLTTAAEPEYLRFNFINGIKHLPVRFTPTPSRAAAAIESREQVAREQAADQGIL